LTCRELIGRLADFSCGDLPAAEARESKRHLTRCESCAGYWRSYRTTVALARAAYANRNAGPPEIPEELVRGILAAARSRPAGLSPRAWRLVHLLSGIAAAPIVAFYLH
jgi:anti-sigma factor RsiW